MHGLIVEVSSMIVKFKNLSAVLAQEARTNIYVGLFSNPNCLK